MKALRVVDGWPFSCLVLCGHPCCLKTSITRKLAFSNDVLALHSSNVGVIHAKWGKAFRKQRDQRYRNLFRILDVVLSVRMPVIVDGTFENARERSRLLKLCKRHEVPLSVVYCYSSRISVIRKRFEKRRSMQYGPDFRASTTAIYFDSLRRYTRIGADEWREFDSFALLDSGKKQVSIVKSSSPLWDTVFSKVGRAARSIKG